MEVLELTEAKPAAYPVAPSGLSDEAQALDSDALWARIELHIAHRWSLREVIWIIEGPGCFVPTLAPATVSLIEIWQVSDWVEALLAPSPQGGYVMPGAGPYRFTAAVGSGPVPAEGNEAYKRLAEYLVGMGEVGASHYESDVAGLREVVHRPAAWVSKAMVLSGAADLLRSYRRA